MIAESRAAVADAASAVRRAPQPPVDGANPDVVE